MTNGLPLRRLFSSLDVRDCDNSTRKCRWRANRHSTIPLEDKAAKIGESRGTEASEVNYSNPAEVMAFRRAETVLALGVPGESTINLRLVWTGSRLRYRSASTVGTYESKMARANILINLHVVVSALTYLMVCGKTTCPWLNRDGCGPPPSSVPSSVIASLITSGGILSCSMIVTEAVGGRLAILTGKTEPPRTAWPDPAKVRKDIV